MKKIKLIGYLTLLILVLIVILQNTEAMQTDILFMTVSMPRAALLLTTMLIGVIMGIAIAFSYLGRSAKK
jgi:uncharacterized integral membrane protein